MTLLPPAAGLPGATQLEALHMLTNFKIIHKMLATSKLHKDATEMQTLATSPAIPKSMGPFGATSPLCYTPWSYADVKLTSGKGKSYPYLLYLFLYYIYIYIPKLFDPCLESPLFSHFCRLVSVN